MLSLGRWPSVPGCTLRGQFVQLPDSVSLVHLFWIMACLQHSCQHLVGTHGFGEAWEFEDHIAFRMSKLGPD